MAQWLDTLWPLALGAISLVAWLAYLRKDAQAALAKAGAAQEMAKAADERSRKNELRIVALETRLKDIAGDVRFIRENMFMDPVRVRIAQRLRSKREAEAEQGDDQE